MTDALPHIRVTDAQARNGNPVTSPSGPTVSSLKDGKPKSGSSAEGQLFLFQQEACVATCSAEGFTKRRGQRDLLPACQNPREELHSLSPSQVPNLAKEGRISCHLSTLCLT